MYLKCVLFVAAILCSYRSLEAQSSKPPNVILFFIDDMGYADIGPFGAKAYETPHLDQMARNGRLFTDFVVTSAVCSASRSALMTGCIHERVGFRGALGPQAKTGISQSETTIAEICKSKGYATACFGKWHLGHHPKFLPTQHGFDRYYGLPYSNDMWPFHPESLAAVEKDPARKPSYPPLPMVENDRVVDAEVTAEDQKRMTRDYTERAVQFVNENATRPFFLYMPHSMVHVPLFSAPEFEGKSAAGPFADAVREVDWSVGQILSTLKRWNIEESTLVIFTTDNGPWLSYGKHAGSAGPLREGKGTAWEGGVRVPTIMQWPGQIPSGSRCAQLACTIDLLPTIAKLIGADPPSLPIDGHEIIDLMRDDAAKSPHQSIPYYYANGQLQAIRNDRWKLVFPHEYRSINGQVGRADGKPVSYVPKQIKACELYDLDADIGEAHNMAEQHPEIVESLNRLADEWRQKLGDSLTQVVGSEIRPADRIMGSDRLLGQ